MQLTLHLSLDIMNINMENFSLEDDDCRELFITQSSGCDNSGVNLVGLLDNPSDFHSPCKSLITGNVMQYSDISDEDDFAIPCSQKKLKTSHGDEM